MFHVKHWLWWRSCSGRRVVCCWAGLLGVPVGGGPPASRPRPELRSARRLEARPGPAAAHGHRSLAHRTLRRPPHRRHLVCWCVARRGPAAAHGHRSQALTPPTAPPPVISNVQPASESPVIRKYIERYTFSTDLSRHFPPISLSRPLTLQPGLAALAGLVVSGALIQLRGVVLVERDVGEWCLVPVRVCKKSAAPAGLRTCVELRRGRNSLSGGRPSPGAWRRRAR